MVCSAELQLGEIGSSEYHVIRKQDAGAEKYCDDRVHRGALYLEDVAKDRVLTILVAIWPVLNRVQNFRVSEKVKK